MIKQPKSKAALAKFRYAVSEKMPKGQAYDPAQCAMIVFETKNPKNNWQCSRKAGYGVNKLWCPNHATAIEAHG